MRDVVMLFAVTRIVLLATVLGAVVSFPPRASATAVSNVPLLNAFAQWDGGAYLYVAQHGYRADSSTSYASYFPLYPLLMKLGGTLLGGSGDAYLIAGIVIANLSTLGALAALTRLGSHERSTLLSAAGYLTVFPTTVFLSAVYADAFFIALAVASAATAQRGSWLRSGTLAMAAALTRPFGGVALVPLAVEVWRTRAFTARAFVALALAPAAVALFVAYLYALTGDPLAVVHGYSSGFTARGPLQSITDLFDPTVYGFPWLIGASLLLSVALVILSWRRTSASLAGYATAMLLVIALAGSLASSMRYELSLYPMFITLATINRGTIRRLVWLVASALIAAAFAAMFALSYWVG
jgi:hypothetical protein